MKFWSNRLGIKLAAMVSVILIPLLLSSFLWFEFRAENMARDEQEAHGAQVAESLVATLSSIMLSGNAEIARFWLDQVSAVPGVKSAKIFRADGAEAFQDRTTLEQVNRHVGEQRFFRNDVNKADNITVELLPYFNRARSGEVEIIHSEESKLMSYIAPIHNEKACMGCHGYDSNPIRGVLVLGLSTDSFQAAATETKRDMINILILIVLLLSLAIWLVIRRQILVPLETITRASSSIREGDLSSKIALNRDDELGQVASTFDLLVDDLKQKISHESDLRLRQEAITDAVISLGEKVASASLLEHIGKISMQITNAPYAMISYVKNGEKQFISQGLSAEAEEKISHMPEGKGLLGLLWDEGETVRVEEIAGHPQSSGFPEGHPPMQAFLGTPICFETQILGTIYLSKAPGESPFTADDEKALVLLASACAIALSNTKNFESVKQANEKLESRVSERTQELNKANKILKTHEIELELMNEELVAANRAKDQFLANTSHELRTPLNAIIGFSELLTDKRAGELSAKQHRYVEHVHNSGKRLLSIINDLLDISKIEAGMMEIQETSFSPVQFGQQIISELKPLAGSNSVELKLIEQVGEDLNIQTDRDKLHQILVNLIGNAIKFTPEGGAVEIGIEMDSAAQSGCESNFSCYIKDNGIGIPVEDQEKIFLPFTQSSGGLDRAHGGTGLGLSLSKRMVQLLGGTIQLTSEVNKGSTFHIDLPVIVIKSDKGTKLDAEVDAVTDQQQDAEAATEEVHPDIYPQPLIMIVDENRHRALKAEEMFSQEGYQVKYASIDEVEEDALNTSPFLIVLGVPDNPESIYDQIEHIKRSTSANRTPTILMAGDADVPRFSAGGTIGQIEKGMQRNDLLEMVSHYGKHLSPAPTAPTVLVVDDEESVREYLKEALAPEGYHILLASNGAEGVRLAIEREPDLIILDLMMPGMTGFEVVDKLREHPTACDIPVVIFTAKDLSREEALLLGHDVERILIKGVSKKGDVLNQLHKLELLYPVQAKLIDVKMDCFNQRYMQRRLDHEIARSIRYSHHFSLVAWEMDGFDNYCKKHGKRWGNAALKATVSTGQSIIRRGDVLARIGDSNFILLLPGISIEGTSRVAEKIRLRIGHQRLPLPGNEIGKLTASIGMVTSAEAQDADELMAMLKRRVIMAVEEGGNRTIMED